MAGNDDAAEATDRHRREQLAIRADAIMELRGLWQGVDVANLRGTIGSFTTAAASLARSGFRRSVASAAAYYTVFRQAEQVAGAAPVVVATVAAGPVLADDLRGSALSGIVDGRRRGMTLSEAADSGFVKVAGALAKQILAGGRMTILESVQKDPVALGWARVTNGDPCAFCRMLASRGAIYKTKKTADFEAHGQCACTIEPLYSREQPKLGALAQAETYLQEFTAAQEWARNNGNPSKGTKHPSLNNYRRWLANGMPEPSGTGGNVSLG